MKLYFLSSRPCALTLNDVYFGVTDLFERFADVSLQDNIFIRFTPEHGLPIGFFLTENIRFQSPDGCETYLLKDGIAIYARDFPPTDFTLKLIAQQRYQDNLATVFQQGEIQLALETPQGFFNATLPPAFHTCQLFFHNNLWMIQGENALTVYTLNGKCLLQEKILDFSVTENTLNATLPLSDTLNRVADCSWELSPDALSQTKFSLRQQFVPNNAKSAADITNDLLPFAFFESVLIGANWREMLCDDLLPDADKIREFLGDFVAVTPTEDPSTCALLKQRGERLYEAFYYTAVVENGKIIDVKG